MLKLKQMKRISIVLALLVFSVCSIAQIKVACIGNSITYGFGYDNPNSYPSQLDSMLGEGWEVKNFGVSGATMLRNGDLPYYKQKAYSDAQSYQPDVVIIKLGTNDSKPQNWQYADQFKADYAAMIAELKALPSAPFIVLCTPVPAYSAAWGINDSIIRQQITIVKSLVKENRLKLVNLYKPLSSHAAWFGDGIHPNEEGLKEIARVLASSLQRYKKKISKRAKQEKAAI